MGQVLHNNATTNLAIGKEIQDVPEEIWKLKFGNRFRGILKSPGIDRQSLYSSVVDRFNSYLGERKWTGMVIW